MSELPCVEDFAAVAVVHVAHEVCDTRAWSCWNPGGPCHTHPHKAEALAAGNQDMLDESTQLEGSHGGTQVQYMVAGGAEPREPRYLQV